METPADMEGRLVAIRLVVIQPLPSCAGIRPRVAAPVVIRQGVSGLAVVVIACNGLKGGIAHSGELYLNGVTSMETN